MSLLIGLDPKSVSNEPEFDVGQIGSDGKGEYVYVRASGAIPGRGSAVVMDADSNASALSASNDAAGGRIGVALAPARDGQFLWAAVRGSVPVHVAAGYNASAELHATDHPGIVDDAAVGPAIIGLVGEENTFNHDGVVRGWATYPTLAPAVAAGGPSEVAAANVTGVGGEANLSVFADKVDDRLDEAEELDAGLRRTITIVDGADLTPAVGGAAYRLRNSVAFPPFTPDSHVRLSVGGVEAQRKEFNSLNGLSTAGEAAQLDDSDSIRFTIGGRLFRIALETGTRHPLLSSDDVDPIDDVSIYVDELVVEPYARKDSAATMPASRLAAGSIPREKLDQATQDVLEKAVEVDSARIEDGVLHLGSDGGHTAALPLPQGGGAPAEDSITPAQLRVETGKRVSGRFLTFGNGQFGSEALEGVKVLYDGPGPGRAIPSGSGNSYTTPFTLLSPDFDLDEQGDGLIVVEWTPDLSQESVSTISLKPTDAHVVGHVSLAALKAMPVRDASTPTVFEGVRVCGFQTDDTAKGTTELDRRIALTNFWFAKDAQNRLGQETITDGFDDVATRHWTFGSHVRITLIGAALAAAGGGTSIPAPAAGDVGSFWGARAVGDQGWTPPPDAITDGTLTGRNKAGSPLSVAESVRYSDAKVDARVRAGFKDLLQDEAASKESVPALSGDRRVKAVANLNLQFTVGATNYTIGRVAREEGSDHRLSVEITPAGSQAALQGHALEIGDARYHFSAARFEGNNAGSPNFDDYSWANAEDIGTSPIEFTVYEPLSAKNFVPAGTAGGQVPTWDATDEEWKAQAPAASGSATIHKDGTLAGANTEADPLRVANPVDPSTVVFQGDEVLTEGEDNVLTAGDVIITRNDLRPKKVADADEASNQITLAAVGPDPKNGNLTGYSRDPAVGALRSASWITELWMAAADGPSATVVKLSDGYPATMYAKSGSVTATLGRDPTDHRRFTSNTALPRAAGTVITFWWDAGGTNPMKVSPEHKLVPADARGAQHQSHSPASDITLTTGTAGTYSYANAGTSGAIGWTTIATTQPLTANGVTLIEGRVSGKSGAVGAGGADRIRVHARIVLRRAGQDTIIDEDRQTIRNGGGNGWPAGFAEDVRYGSVKLGDKRLCMVGDILRMEARAIAQQANRSVVVTSVPSSTKIEAVLIG